MSAEEYFGQFYRAKPGDTGHANLPVLSHGLEEAKGALGKMLLAQFNNPGIISEKKPHHANLVGNDGAILSTVMVVPSLRGGYEIENVF